MPIQHRANQPRQPQRQHVEHAVIPAGGFVGFRDEAALPQVVFDIFDFLLPGAPAEFKPSQTLVPEGCPSQMQGLCAIPRVPFDGLPHDDIRPAQMLEGLVRRPVFINGPRAQLKINRGGNGTLFGNWRWQSCRGSWTEYARKCSEKK